MNNSENLWKKINNLEAKAASLKTPHTILKEQAKYLGEATRRVLEGFVLPVGAREIKINKNQMGTGIITPQSDSYEFGSEFWIIAPFYNDYRHHLLSVYYNIDCFPCLIDFNDTKIIVNNEDEFMTKLLDIFALDETESILTFLLTQSQ